MWRENGNRDGRSWNERDQSRKGHCCFDGHAAVDGKDYTMRICCPPQTRPTVRCSVGYCLQSLTMHVVVSSGIRCHHLERLGSHHGHDPSESHHVREVVGRGWASLEDSPDGGSVPHLDRRDRLT